MGAYDGAEVTELIGIYLLSKIKTIIPSAGLYRDNSLGALKLSGPQLAKVEKKLHKIFKDHGFSIKVETNLKKTDFLDFQLCLEKGTVKAWIMSQGIYKCQVQLSKYHNKMSAKNYCHQTVWLIYF